MNEYYVEWMIERKLPAALAVIRVAMIVLTVLVFICSFLFFPLGAVIGFLMVIVDAALMLFKTLEYEFIFVGDDLMIDRIFNRSFRRRAYKCAMKDVEIAAPEGSDRLKDHDRVKPEKSYWFTSRQEGSACWVLYICEENAGGRRVRLCIEPDKALLNAIRLTVSPRNYFTD